MYDAQGEKRPSAIAMPGRTRTTTFDTWLAFSNETAAKREVAGKYGGASLIEKLCLLTTR